MDRKFIISILIFILCLITKSTNAQNSRVGDGFGGRLWYKPYNFSAGSYSAFTTCDTNNQLYGWGANYFGEIDSSIANTIVPFKIPGMTNVEYITCGYCSAAILYDHTGWFWGGPSTSGRSTIAPLKVIDSAIFADAGSHSCSFVKSDGTVWSVGRNEWGVFGDGTAGTGYASFSTAKKMNGVHNAVRTAMGKYTHSVLLSDSTVVVVGSNIMGGLGIGSVSSVLNTAPQKIDGLKDIIDIKANCFSTIALDKNGDVWQWGAAPDYWSHRTATYATYYTTPQKLSGLKNIVAISGCDDGDHFLALDEFHNLYAWMFSYVGAAGHSGGLRFLDSATWIDSNVVDIMAGETFSYIIKTDGNLYAAGSSLRASIFLDKAYYDTLAGGAPAGFHKLNPDTMSLCAPVKKESLRPKLRVYDSFYCALDSGILFLPSYGTVSMPYYVKVSPDTGFVIDSANLKIKFFPVASSPLIYTITTAPKDTTDLFFIRDTLVFTPRTYPKPIADFKVSPYAATIAHPKFIFINTSKDAVKYLWYSHDSLISDSSSFVGEFPQVGKYCVKLVAYNKCGLKDSTTYCFVVVDTTQFLPPKDTVLCKGKEVLMDIPLGYKPVVTPATGFLWDSVAHVLHFSPSTDTRYTVIKDPEIVDTAFVRDSVTFTLHVLPAYVIETKKDTILCPGASLVYTVANKGVFSHWNDGDTSKTRVFTDSGVYWSYAIKDCDTYVDTLVIKISRDTVIETLDTIVCFVKSFSVSPKSNYNSYVWNDGSIARENIFTENGTKWVIASNYTCHIHIDTFKVTLTNFDLNIFDTAMCNKQPIVLNATIAQPAQYLWQDGSKEKIDTVKQPGKYWVEVAAGSCKKKKEINVGVILEDFDLGNDTVVCEGQLVTLQANVNNNVSCLWQNGDTTRNLVATQNGTYYIQVSEAGCVVEDSISVKYRKCSNCFSIPNAFTPNADGKNDAFKPICSCLVKSYSMIIMNRYGQKIFQSYNPDESWNGKVNNIDEEIGVYYYLIKVQFDYSGAKEELYKGDITLLR